jgi:hypothetical protein
MVLHTGDADLHLARYFCVKNAQTCIYEYEIMHPDVLQPQATGAGCWLKVKRQNAATSRCVVLRDCMNYSETRD